MVNQGSGRSHIKMNASPPREKKIVGFCIELAKSGAKGEHWQVQWVPMRVSSPFQRWFLVNNKGPWIYLRHGRFENSFHDGGKGAGKILEDCGFPISTI